MEKFTPESFQPLCVLIEEKLDEILRKLTTRHQAKTGLNGLHASPGFLGTLLSFVSSDNQLMPASHRRHLPQELHPGLLQRPDQPHKDRQPSAQYIRAQLSLPQAAHPPCTCLNLLPQTVKLISSSDLLFPVPSSISTNFLDALSQYPGKSLECPWSARHLPSAFPLNHHLSLRLAQRLTASRPPLGGNTGPSTKSQSFDMRTLSRPIHWHVCLAAILLTLSVAHPSVSKPHQQQVLGQPLNHCEPPPNTSAGPKDPSPNPNNDLLRTALSAHHPPNTQSGFSPSPLPQSIERLPLTNLGNLTDPFAGRRPRSAPPVSSVALFAPLPSPHPSHPQQLLSTLAAQQYCCRKDLAQTTTTAGSNWAPAKPEINLANFLSGVLMREAALLEWL
ncbi:hypothetical protein PtA15_10A252 [Puccinia triticina]|uniref:Uncharacterized protein n=1 Tax=Puccinia triticina TaxID=208348 RepID=A0ABY7CXV6_9BASI|nr:uncharacterized protein PtA15_10A252 [Puccinia triticina]WAQ88832.1 hypothetical protein PtA15_10A252 [Puccinia triticina]